MKGLIFVFLACSITVCCYGQSITGRWQLIKQTSCLEGQVDSLGKDAMELVASRSGMSTHIPKVMQLRDNHTGEENIQLLNKRKPSETSTFLYKSDANTLYILDKRSHTVSSYYNIEALSADSLILSNGARACETRVFLRIK